MLCAGYVCKHLKGSYQHSHRAHVPKLVLHTAAVPDITHVVVGAGTPRKPLAHVAVQVLPTRVGEQPGYVPLAGLVGWVVQAVAARQGEAGKEQQDGVSPWHGS
jgi:hypothetical protein